MPNRISPITVGGVSVWDVLFPLKQGPVDPSHDFAAKHQEMLTAALGRTVDDLSDFTWVESMRALLGYFQRRIANGKTSFEKVKALYFLKLSLSAREDGGYWVSFQTEFHDPHADERAYVADMYAHYGDMLEVFWRHCEGVEKLVDPPSTPNLSEEFLLLVDRYKIDNQPDGLSFFVQNPGVGPERVETLLADSEKLRKVGEVVDTMRPRADAPDADHRALLGELIEQLDAATGGGG